LRVTLREYHARPGERLTAGALCFYFRAFMMSRHQVSELRVRELLRTVVRPAIGGSA
jgi:hypothetical protein